MNVRSHPKTAGRGADPDAASRALAGLDLHDVHIETVGDRLYLRGIAGCYQTKRAAARIVGSAVPGFTVINELRVVHAPSDDATVARNVHNTLRTAAPAAINRITVDVLAGNARLTGRVTGEDERRAVEAAVWRTPGVCEVRSDLRIEEDEAGDEEVTAWLSSYLQRAVRPACGEVGVRYRAGVATLAGYVASDDQARAVEDLVRWHDRVMDVVNQLNVRTPLAAVS